MHGASQIFNMKNDKVDSGKTVNLDQLIKEGEEKHHKNMQAAAQDITTKTSAFDLQIQTTPTFVFQNHDFQAERKKVDEEYKY